jgi:hypothetical protein
VSTSHHQADGYDPGMDPAVESPAGGAVPKYGGTADEDAGDSGRMRPDWFHREHPVFFPLAGFFTGMLYIILVPGIYTAVLAALVNDERAEELFPFVALAFVVPIALLVPRRTRRFGRYMLFGTLATIVVVVGVGAVVLWYLLRRDG